MELILADWLNVRVMLALGAILSATYLLYRRYGNRNGLKLPPGFPYLPVIGSMPWMTADIKQVADFSMSPDNKFGKIWSFYLGSKLFVVVNGRQALYEALVTRDADFADRVYSNVESRINPKAKGVFNAFYTAAFRKHQQLIMSTLKRFGYGTRVMETRIVREVEEMISEVRKEEGRPSNLKPLMGRCAANVMMGMLYGRRFEHSDPEFQRLIYNVNELFGNVTLEMEFFPLLFHLPPYKKILNKCMTSLIEMTEFARSKVEDTKKDPSMAESFVHYYIESEGPNYDEEQLFYTIRDLMAGGMETQSTTLGWAIVLLCNNPKIQERLHAEVDAVIGRHRSPTLDDRPKMPLAEATALEVLRLKTFVPVVDHATLCDTEVGGYFVPRGTTVLMNYYSVHVDPKEFPDPKEFNPDRFLDDNLNVVGRDRIVPFGLGKRACIGQQLARQEFFLFLVGLLQKFYFRPPEGQDSIDAPEVWNETVALPQCEIRMIPRD